MLAALRNTWIRTGEAGRNEIRAALKTAKENHKTKEETAQKLRDNGGIISHAKVRTPPPHAPCTLDDALMDLEEALIDQSTEESAIIVFFSYSQEQQAEVAHRLEARAIEGAAQDGFDKVANVVFKPFYETKICSLEVMAMVSGYAGKKYDTLGMLSMLQTAKKTA